MPAVPTPVSDHESWPIVPLTVNVAGASDPAWLSPGRDSEPDRFRALQVNVYEPFVAWAPASVVPPAACSVTPPGASSFRSAFRWDWTSPSDRLAWLRRFAASAARSLWPGWPSVTDGLASTE